MNKPPLKILLVEGDPEEVTFFLSVQSTLPELRLEWTYVERLVQGIHRLGEERFDIILLDLSLPDSQGLEALAKIQIRAGKIPLIVLVAPEEQGLGIQAV